MNRGETMDIEKTRKYYESLKDEDVCDCEWCQNFIFQIKEAYPKVTKYLDGMGVDIEKPYESWSLDPDENGNVLYPDVMYEVMGSSEGFVPTKIGDVDIHLAKSYPYSDLKEEHFVIELSSFLLKDLRKK